MLTQWGSGIGTPLLLDEPWDMGINFVLGVVGWYQLRRRSKVEFFYPKRKEELQLIYG